jgi:hypothetical protein
MFASLPGWTPDAGYLQNASGGCTPLITAREDMALGPNARKRPRLDGAELPKMTHTEADKLIARQLSSGPPGGRWIIKARFSPDSFSSGGPAYWGNLRGGGTGLTPYRTNAIEYESENAALYEGFSLKEARRINEFVVEQVPPKPARSSYGSGSGRA